MVTSAISRRQRETRDSVVIRFAGRLGGRDAVTGSQFTLETALAGSDFSTFPISPGDPCPDRARRSASRHSRSHFGARRDDPGDAVDVLSR